MSHLRLVSLLLVAGLVACEPGTAPPSSPALSVGAGSQVSGLANGGGHYSIGDLIVQFSISGVGAADGGASGQFHHSLTVDGELVEFHGGIICMPTDPVNHRAWIGGVITENRSTHPDFLGGIFEPGRDIWFRVVDYGQGEGAPPDRTTFVGFTGSAGVETSLEYCALRLWPDGDARTWPVAGNLTVRP